MYLGDLVCLLGRGEVGKYRVIHLCSEIGQLLVLLPAPLLPLMEDDPNSEITLNPNTRQMLYGPSQGILQLWGFLSCKGHVAAICTFSVHKASGLDPVVKSHALQNIPNTHIDINRSTA